MNRLSLAGLNCTQVTANAIFEKEMVSSNSEVKSITSEAARDYRPTEVAVLKNSDTVCRSKFPQANSFVC
jgi:hypothetical protein